MITSLISGKLISDPRSGQSANGNAWCRVTVACPVQGGREGEPESVVATVIAFGGEARKLEKLSKGDAVSAVGSSRISIWQKGDEMRTGLDVVANEVLTPYLVRQKRNPAKDEAHHGPEARQAANAFYGKSNAEYDDDLNDRLTF